MVDAGAVPLLGLCLQEPETALKRIAASSLADIASHTPSLATTLIETHLLPHLFTHLHLPSSPSAANSIHPIHADLKLVRQVVRCLGNVAKHSNELAEYVVDGDIFPGLWACFKINDEPTRKTSAELVCHIVKQSAELAQLVVHSGGAAVLVDYLTHHLGSSTTEGILFPGVLALGYIASLSEMLALAVVVAKAIPALMACLEINDDVVRGTACWALGQLGKHSPEHAKHLTDAGVLMKLLQIMQDEQGESELKSELQTKVRGHFNFPST